MVSKIVRRSEKAWDLLRVLWKPRAEGWRERSSWHGENINLEIDKRKDFFLAL